MVSDVGPRKFPLGKRPLESLSFDFSSFEVSFCCLFALFMSSSAQPWDGVGVAAFTISDAADQLSLFALKDLLAEVYSQRADVPVQRMASLAALVRTGLADEKLLSSSDSLPSSLEGTFSPVAASSPTSKSASFYSVVDFDGVTFVRRSASHSKNAASQDVCLGQQASRRLLSVAAAQCLASAAVAGNALEFASSTYRGRILVAASVSVLQSRSAEHLLVHRATLLSVVDSPVFSVEDKFEAFLNLR